MAITNQRFQSFITRVRPHRVAVFTNNADPHWYHSCLSIMEFYVKLWGGSRCVVIPTDGKTIAEEFWAILSSHDPDILFRYQPTGADQKARAPHEFDELVTRETKKCAGENNVAEHQVRDQIEKSLLKTPFDAWSISDELNQQLLMRLAPFHFEDQPVYGMQKRHLNIYSITKGSSPHHPLTSIFDVLKAADQRSQITRLSVDQTAAVCPPLLWFAATIGCGDDEYFDELSKQQIKPVFTPVTAENVLQMTKVGIRPWTYTIDSFPMGLTNVALSSVHPTASRRFALPTIAVVGDSVRDFCLYLALYWQQGRALWLPRWFIPTNELYPARLMTAVGEAEDVGRLEHNERMVLVSYSTPETELDKLRETIRAHTSRISISSEKITANLIAEQVKHPLRVYADGNIGDVTTHLLINDSLPGWFESPAPRKLNPVSPLSHRWIVDITFMQHLIPRHPALGARAIYGPNVGDTRAGRGCVSYMCPGSMVLGDDMETNILRPSIHVPDAEEIFRVILDDCGYRSTMSDKGRYEAEAVRKFGGLDKVGYALWSDKHRRLLMKFLDKTKPGKGVYDEGVYLKDDRRYLSFLAIAKLLASESLARETIDEYIESGIFYRGFIFMCHNCSDATWYSIAELEQTFTCPRCNLKQQYKSTNWKHPNEPSWFYKLDEMIYLMLKNNGHVPLLTLNRLQQRSKESFLFRHEIRLTPTGETKMFLEVDVCCIPNGRLCIGEAKSNDSIAGTNLTEIEAATRYHDLALKMGALLVVFSTCKPAWDLASQDAMRTAFQESPHIEVIKLTAADLYGTSGPY